LHNVLESVYGMQSVKRSREKQSLSRKLASMHARSLCLYVTHLFTFEYPTMSVGYSQLYSHLTQHGYVNHWRRLGLQFIHIYTLVHKVSHQLSS